MLFFEIEHFTNKRSPLQTEGRPNYFMACRTHLTPLMRWMNPTKQPKPIGSDVSS